MPLSEQTQRLLLSALGSPEAVTNLIADIENIITSEIADGAVTTPKLADLAATNAKIAAGIDAAKIADGSVSSAEFQFINTLTSNAQTQINGKQASGNYITALTGDVTAAGPGSSAASIADATVTGKLITGYVSGAGAVAASDTILQSINKLNGNSASNTAILAGVNANSAATTPGTVVKKIEIFNSTGVSLGFIAVYDAIT